MCGRFILAKAPSEIANLFQLAEPPDILTPRYNIAPTQNVPVVGLKPDGVTRGLKMMRWGLVPSWAQDTKGRPQTIARAETVRDKPMFADLIESKRCLIVAEGFIEWRKDQPGKDPHLFRLKSHDAFAFAGLWDAWMDPKGKHLLSCCFITTKPNDLVASLHDRMPVILRPDEYAKWLSPKSDHLSIMSLLNSYPASEMESVALTTRINSVKHDDPACIAAA